MFFRQINRFFFFAKMSDNEEEPSTPGPTYTTAPSGGHYGLEDPHFEQIVNEIDNIQDVVDMLVFGSVFLRQPQGISAGSAGEFQ
jgi:hypothetical protein